VYRFIVDAELALRATVVADARAETSITLIPEGDAAPIGPFDHSLMRRLEPGTYRVQVQAPADQEHLFALTAEPSR
jgi:hypothetical protein